MSWFDYDRERKMVWVLNNIKTHCILWYDDKIRCLVCNEDNIEWLTIHHEKYYSDSIVYDEKNRTKSGQVVYYSKLLNEIMLRPFNFKTLCNNCHHRTHLIKKFLSKPKDEGQESL